MKIDITNLDTENFIVAPKDFHGETVLLVIPQHIGCKWTADNLHFRSSVWNMDGELISASFPKFFNWGEHPELTPPPSSLKSATLVEKVDGSTLIVSKYKGNFMIRTRGTTDASQMEKNGWEIEYLMDKYPEIENAFSNTDTWSVSVIFEWISPNNQIVINYAEPDIRLIGMIRHDDYSLYTQEELDTYAHTYFGVQRPKTFTFKNIDDMMNTIGSMTGQEGVVVYFNGDQSLLKVKSEWYLVRHRMKDLFRDIENIVDFYFNIGCPDSFDVFLDEINKVVDWETFNTIRGDMSKIFDAKKELDKIVQHMRSFVEPLKSMARKDAALKIIDSYGQTNRSSFCFKLLDGKELDQKDNKKLLMQCLK